MDAFILWKQRWQMLLVLALLTLPGLALWFTAHSGGGDATPRASAIVAPQPLESTAVQSTPATVALRRDANAGLGLKVRNQPQRLEPDS